MTIQNVRQSLFLIKHNYSMSKNRNQNSTFRKYRKQERTRGRWTEEENMLYLEFLSDNLAQFESIDSRRKNFVFRTMAELILTRDYEQCRSHHQKMEKKFGSTQEILLNQSPNKLRKDKNQPEIQTKEGQSSVLLGNEDVWGLDYKLPDYKIKEMEEPKWSDQIESNGDLWGYKIFD